MRDSAATVGVAAGGGEPRSRILVVDDDVAIGGTIKRYLRQYDCDVADSVEDALRHLDERSYDLLLLDRRLPDGLGDTVIENVRQRRWSLPIIMMSGEIDPQQFQPPETRADDYIEKPFVREALVEKIARLLTAHELRRQAARQRHELAEMHERHDHEVAVARTIFDRLFARGEFPAASVRHLVLAADRLAGDVVFGVRLGDDVYRWMIGDVTGHTLSSALVTMPLAVIFYKVARERRGLADLLRTMELEMVGVLPPNMFCVAAVCELDRRTGTLRVWNGGNPDVLIRRASGEVAQIASDSAPLAADRYGEVSHAISEHRVMPGDRIYAFSDGLIELRDATNQMIGFERLLDIARTTAPDQIFDRFRDCIPERPGATGYDDDVSLIEVIV